MALSKFYESTIVEVRATFGFNEFDCDPTEISNALEIDADDIRRKGEKRKLRGGREIESSFNSWCIISKSTSKDINVHLRELLDLLEGKQKLAKTEFGIRSFGVAWKGNYLYSGSGPFYEPDVVKGIASWDAQLNQDIYQIDQEENGPVSPTA